MATSGSKTVAIFSWIDLKFSWWQNSQSVANNTTTIGWKLELITDSSGAVYKKNRTWTVNIDGQAYSGTVNVSVDTSSTQQVASGTTTIKHNSDGSKTFAYSFSQQFELTLNSGKYMSTYSGNGTGVLEKNAQASDVTVAQGTLGVQQYISVTKPTTFHTNTITYSCGTASGTVCTKDDRTSIPWTPPIDLATQAPQENTVLVTFTITAYLNDIASGTTKKSVRYAIPDNIVPPVLPRYIDPNGYKEYYGDFIQGKSKLTAIVETYGSYGAWITSRKATFEGKSYGFQDSFTTDTIMRSGELPLSIIVTDSRGRSTEAKSNIKVLAYDVPKILDLSAYRSDSSGNSYPEGDYITVKFSTEIQSLNNKNGAWYKVAYKKSGTSSEKEVALDNYTSQYSVTNGTFTFPVENTSYDIVLKVGDNFSTTPKSVAGPSAKKAFSLLKKAGRNAGVAINKLAELEGVFDIDFQTRFLGGILHPVLPTNSDLNSEKTPKTYMLLTANTYFNVPETGIGMFLEIVGAKDGSLIQRISVFDKAKPREYERIYYTSDGWSDWLCVRGDFVVEQGETDGWTYRKWNSGLAECHKTLEHSTKISKSWGTMYVGDTLMARQNYPFAFVSKPSEFASVASGNPAVWLFAESQGNGVNGAYASAIYNVCRPTANSTANTFYISISVKGKWK